MSDRNLAKGDDVRSDGGHEEHAMAMEAESFVAVKPFENFTSDSGLKEEEFLSEVDVPSDERVQVFSTPMQTEHKRRASIINEPQEHLLDYKSFFGLECDEIVHQLHSKAAQGWSANKRKLEELDISTIEAEPVPLLYYTPKSAWDKTTCSAKRRRIDYEDDECLEKVHGLHQCRTRDRNSIQEKSSPHLNSEKHSKLSLVLKTSRKGHRQNDLPANSDKSVPEGLTSGPFSPLLYYRTASKMNSHHESLTSTLEFRSYFAAECDDICNRLKRPDTEKFICNVSSIDAEPPPVMSDTINSTTVLERSSSCKENSAVGVSQLDLEKMNINYTITEKACLLQKAPHTVLCNSNATGPKENVMVTDTAEVISPANATLDINHEKSADDTVVQENTIVHSQLPTSDIANITHYIAITYDKMTEASTTQGMVKIHDNVSLANDPKANVSMCEDIVKVHHKVSGAINVTHDITMCYDLSVVNGTQVIVAGDDGSAINAIRDNLTKYSKMSLSQNPAETESNDVSLANGTQDIVAISNEAPAVQATQNIGTVCSESSAAPEVMSMFNEVCVASGTREMVMTEKLSKVHLAVDIGSMFGREIDPKDKDRNILTDAALKNVILIKTNANIINATQDIVPIHSGGHINKTFTCCKVTKPNMSHDISETLTSNVKDLTKLISYKHTPNFPANISILDEQPKINATQSLMSIRNEVPANDSPQNRGDLTKVIATNCTLLHNQPDKQTKSVWSMAALAHSTPRTGSMCKIKDSTYNLDLTDIVHDESVFCNKPISFVTSTPLPSLGNQMFIKKSSGLPVNVKSRIFSSRQESVQKGILAQKAAVPQRLVTGQSLGGESKIRGGLSQGLPYPNISRRSIPIVKESSIIRPEPCIPAPCTTLAHTVLKTPHVTKAAVPRKDEVATGRTSRRPPLDPTSLHRKIMQYGQPCKSGTSSTILQQQVPVNCIRNGKDIFKKRNEMSKYPASSLVRPPFGLPTPGCKISAEKVEAIPGPQSASYIRKVSSVNPTSVTGFDQSGTILKEHTVVRPSNPGGSQIPLKRKPRASGLPIRKSQEAYLKPSTK